MTEGNQGHTDLPIEDQKADSLGVAVYIDTLAEFIMKCNTPMTIAIQGDWGSGKTSMMNMVKRQIDNQAMTVWFNTWQFSQFGMQAILPLGLLNALLDKVGRSDGSTICKAGSYARKGLQSERCSPGR